MQIQYFQFFCFFLHAAHWSKTAGLCFSYLQISILIIKIKTDGPQHASTLSCASPILVCHSHFKIAYVFRNIFISKKTELFFYSLLILSGCRHKPKQHLAGWPKKPKAQLLVKHNHVKHIPVFCITKKWRCLCKFFTCPLTTYSYLLSPRLLSYS